MNARHAANDDLPFSYPVKVGHISANPVRIGLEADAEELKALAKFWDVVSVEYLKAELQVSRWKKDGVKIKGEVRTLTASGRMSGTIIGLLPVFIMVLLMMLNPDYIMTFFQTTIGLMMLGVAAILEAIGFLIVTKIVNIRY